MFKGLLSLLIIITGIEAIAQQKCKQADYLQQSLAIFPDIQSRLEKVESFTEQKLQTRSNQRTDGVAGVIRIPVVVHVLYHIPGQNIKEAAIQHMINSLNRDFRRGNSDTVNTPSWFKSLAADMEIEFKLATMDPQGRSTTGVIKKYTPVNYWLSDDKMKFSKSSGSDAWDTQSYLNIWICNMQDVLGYSSLPGMDSFKDGVVISTENFLSRYKTITGKNDFRVLVHEVGHWLNLLHIWGDSYCGSDHVDDTPKQSTYTPGCPGGTRLSCGNSLTGDMYMNYMDFTEDACMNMFTSGQKSRARVLFEPGGPRSSILNSKGLEISSIPAAALPDFYPRWMFAQVYPNPANGIINLNVEYDERWIGREMQIIDMNGRVMMRIIINSKIQEIDISRLHTGVYFIRATKDDESIHTKFVKL